MKTILGNYGEVRFCDNMDLDDGIPAMQSKSFDAVITDPPYGGGVKKKGRINYADEFLGLDWFFHALRIGENVAFTSGQIRMFDYPKPNLIICWYKPACCGHNCVGGMCNWEPILYYGKKRISIDVIKTPAGNKSGLTLHSTPKPVYLWTKLINLIQPKTVLDPFIGSGTTAQVCEMLGINYIGYELEEKYIPDINKRIKKGIVEHSRYKKKITTRALTLNI